MMYIKDLKWSVVVVSALIKNIVRMVFLVLKDVFEKNSVVRLATEININKKL